MFRGADEVAAVSRLLFHRGVSLWHACQLSDFRSYLTIGGIPSRSLLEQASLSFTPFQTDAKDRSRGVWDKVFVNLSDFGASFAHGASATPNPYGPIVFQLAPAAVARASEAAICMRSAGARDFDREAESLDSLEDLEQIFIYPQGAPFPESSYVLFGDALRERFAPRFPDATSPEASLTLDPELIPLDEVIVVWVDPIELAGGLVVDAVERATTETGSRLKIRPRSLGDSRRQVMTDVVRYLSDNPAPPTLRLLVGRADVAEVTRVWARALLERGLDWQFQRYGSYLRDGTLACLQDVLGARTADPTREPVAGSRRAPHG